MSEPLMVRCTGHEFTESEYGSKRVLYLIDVTLGVHTITVKKRARDFYRLHNQLCSKFSKHELPTLPPRTVFRSFKPEYVQEKTLALGAYLTRLKENVAVLQSADFQEFLGDANLLVLLAQQQRATPIKESKSAPTSPTRHEVQSKRQKESEAERISVTETYTIDEGDSSEDESSSGKDLEKSQSLWTEAVPTEFTRTGTGSEYAEVDGSDIDDEDSPRARASKVSQLTRATISERVIRTLPKIPDDAEQILREGDRATGGPRSGVGSIGIIGGSTLTPAEAAAQAAITAAETAAQADDEWSPASQFAAAEAAREASRARCLILSERLQRVQEALLEERQAAARYKGERDKTAAEMHLINLQVIPQQQQQHAAELKALRAQVAGLEAARARDCLALADAREQLDAAHADRARVFVQLEQERKHRLQANEALARQQEQAARLRREKKVLVAELRERRRVEEEEAAAGIAAQGQRQGQGQGKATGRGAGGADSSSSRSRRTSNSSSSSNDRGKSKSRLSVFGRSSTADGNSGNVGGSQCASSGSGTGCGSRRESPLNVGTHVTDSGNDSDSGPYDSAASTALSQPSQHQPKHQPQQRHPKQPAHLRVSVLRAEKLCSSGGRFKFTARQLQQGLDRRVLKLAYVRATLFTGGGGADGHSAARTVAVQGHGACPVWSKLCGGPGRNDDGNGDGDDGDYGGSNELQLEVRMSFHSFSVAIAEEVAWLTLEVYAQTNKAAQEDDLLGTVRLVPEEMAAILSESLGNEAADSDDTVSSDKVARPGHEHQQSRGELLLETHREAGPISPATTNKPCWYPLDTGGRLQCSIQFFA